MESKLEVTDRPTDALSNAQLASIDKADDRHYISNKQSDSFEMIPASSNETRSVNHNKVTAFDKLNAERPNGYNEFN
ncbi:MAG TPA: hypothetical protein VEL11_17635 [Candidatus Bathyarchaeia archaeon]|nr:hypothetical protein [Candidatus Bathyarchaeia archaeon]